MGAYAYYMHPAIINRDCNYCMEYFHNNDGPQPDPITGGPYKRPKRGYGVDCSVCPKKDFKHGWIGDNERIFHEFLITHDTGCFPRAGTMYDQEFYFAHAYPVLTQIADDCKFHKLGELIYGK
jgi:hypothetical protein